MRTMFNLLILDSDNTKLMDLDHGYRNSEGKSATDYGRPDKDAYLPRLRIRLPNLSQLSISSLFEVLATPNAPTTTPRPDPTKFCIVPCSSGHRSYIRREPHVAPTTRNLLSGRKNGIPFELLPKVSRFLRHDFSRLSSAARGIKMDAEVGSLFPKSEARGSMRVCVGRGSSGPR